MYQGLACLDHYPVNSNLVNRGGRRIRQPKQLCLWYPRKESGKSAEVDSRKLPPQSFVKIEETVVRHGQSQWSSLGYAMGLTKAQVDAECHNKPIPSAKLQAIIRRKVQEIGETQTKTELLDACKHIPSPVYGVVEEDLRQNKT